MELFEVFQYSYAVRALLASSLVGVVCGILGCFIVLRNMALIGDALSHAILPGVVAGFLVAGHSILGFFTGSVIAGFIAAILITWIQRNVKTKDDAAIGIVFTAMFAIGIIGISWLTRQQGVHLDMKDFLFGNVLGISDQDLWLTTFITLYVILSITVFYRYFFITTFEPVIAQTLGISGSTIHYFLMLLLAFTVVASLQSVGVILVVAMLIIPASTAYLLTSKLRNMIILSGLIGFISTSSGLILAIIFETTPGPVMTLTATLIYLLTVFFSPQQGLILNVIRKRQKKKKILLEDILKQMVKLYDDKKLTLENLRQNLNLSGLKLKVNLNELVTQGYLTIKGPEIIPTSEGIKNGYQLIRAHRLWETYLVERVGLSSEQIHDQAEKYEHLLPEDLLDQVEQKLGYPKTDPHGSPIPQKGASSLLTMGNLKLDQKAVITTDQMDEKVTVKLWEMGITPNKPFYLKETKDGYVEIELDEKKLRLDKKLADAVKISILET
ncbi:MAG: metal ABC transporter permease [Bacteroidetes bacterium]|nr:metal ABC transporter permease [Bacteroidota bacterium]